MKIYIILLPFLCGSLGAMVDDERLAELPQKTRKILKDIRLIPMNKVTQSKQSRGDWDDQIQKRSNTPDLERKRINEKNLQTKLGEENNLHLGSNEQNGNLVQNNKEYIQKMANQLFLAQKQVSLLSDYQKSILSQDPLVKRFVFGPSEAAKVPKPFSQFGRRSRTINQNKSHQLNTASANITRNFDSTKMSELKVSRKSDTIISKPHNDNLVQATAVNYVTITPITTSGFVNVKVLPQQEASLQTPKPYFFYDVTVNRKPQIEAISASTTIIPHALPKVTPKASSRASRYIQDSITNIDHHNQHYGKAKYEFKYNVKDHEKNSHFGHMEMRSDETTYGYYFVHLPDGRLETVKYWADKTGFHAKVDYQGEAKHPPAVEYTHGQLYH